MKLQNGGYVIVTHDDANIYEKVAKAFENGKPILFYDDNNTCFYIDSITKGEDVYTLVKGGKTFEVTSSNTLSSTGSVDAPTMENIKDLNGNLRFIEGDIVTSLPEGFTQTYGKWSLSGTHLMFVIGITGTNGSELTADYIANIDNLPSYIMNKIQRVFGNTIEKKDITYYATDSTTQTARVEFLKSSDTRLRIYHSAITLTSDKSTRFQFDLLIDAE